SRRADLDAARGLAIILVVLGHLIARAHDAPPGYEGYLLAKSVIYDFHMPLFLYLSGLTFFLSSQLNPPHGYAHYVRSRSERLLIPFVLFGVVITVGKMLAQYVIFVDQPPKSLVQGVTAIFVGSSDSPVFSIWYMWVLFVYSVATPILWRMMNGYLFAIIPVLLIAPVFITAPQILYLDVVIRFAGFFLLGGLSARMFPQIFRLSPLYIPISLLGFAASLAIVHNAPPELRIVICGLASIPAIHAVLSLREWHQTDILAWLGRNSFVIYLLNTVFIGLTKGIVLRVAPVLIPFVPLTLGLLFAAGLLGPIYLRELGFKFWRPLYQLTR
ncbi:MAG TPA: acyltransferase, partial [Micropepsaceae bacterium]|nr:acyltransferase [Micropepsaceae bacterium]